MGEVVPDLESAIGSLRDFILAVLPSVHAPGLPADLVVARHSLRNSCFNVVQDFASRNTRRAFPTTG